MSVYGYQVGGRTNVRDYLRVLNRRRYTVAVFTLILVALVTLGSFLAIPEYRATTQILIEKENPNVVSFQEVLALDAGDTSYYQTQYKILRSRSLGRDVVRNLRLAEVQEIREPSLIAGMLGRNGVDTDPQALENRAVNNFLKRLEVSPVRNSRLVEVSYTSRDSELAARVANALAQKYVEHELSARLAASQQALGWLNEQVSDLRKKVEAAEEALQRYKEKEKLVALEERENIVVQKLSELNSEVTRAKTDRIGKETLFRQLRELSQNPEMVEAIPAVIENRLIQELKAGYVALQSQYSRLSEKYGPKHPEMIRLASQVNLMKNRIAAEVEKIAASIETEYRVALARERTLVSALESQKKEALELTQKGIKYGVLKREAESNKQLYDILLKRMKETTVTTGLRGSNIRVVDPAESPVSPVRPKRKLNITLALILGLLGGSGLALFLEYLDNTVKSPEDLGRFTGLPFLGSVPHMEKGEGRTGAAIFNQHHSPAAEAYRSLRTSLLFSSPGGPPGAVVVTSALPREGKTTTAINLAYALAQSDKRVALVDADMRKPGLHKELGLNNGAGLSNFLVGTASLEDVVQSTPHPSLMAVTSGPLPPNPSELLGSEKMGQFLAAMKASFDHVIMDSPPLLVVTDPLVLSKLADGVVLVVKTGDTTREVLRAAKKNLTDVGSRTLGSVLNQVEKRRDDYYHGYYFYQYYTDEAAAKKAGRLGPSSSKGSP